MIALVGAMFVAMGSASAAALGNCSSTATNYLKIGDTCTISTDDVGNLDILSHASAADKSIAMLSGGGTYGMATNTADGTNNNPLYYSATGDAITVRANALGTITITDTNDVLNTDAGVGPGVLAVEDPPNADTSYKIEVIPAATLEITFDDSDATVKPGQPVKVGISIKGAAATVPDGTMVTLSVPSTGLFFSGASAGTTSQIALIATGDIVAGSTEGKTAEDKLKSLSTTGAPTGEYTVTATLSGNIGNLKKGSFTRTLTVGDPGKGLASAALALDTNQKASTSLGKTVGLVATAKNSLGTISNGTEVASILVNATSDAGDATILFASCAPTAVAPTNFTQLVESTATATLGLADTDCNGTIETDNSDAAVANDAGVGAVVKFTVGKGTAGTVDIQVTMIGGAAGTATSDTLTLTFAGSADAISVGAASNNLAQKGGEITFEVTATDKGGNAAAVSASSITAVLKSADGETPKNLTVADSQKYTDTDADGEKDDGETDVDTAVIVTVTSDANTKAEAGEYIVEVTLNNDVKTTQSAGFTVAGGAANVDVSSESDMVAVGDIITLTATVTDADGNAVTNPAATETNVDFSTAGALKLAGFGADSNGVVKKATKDGVAEAKFVVTNGSGTAVILVNSGSATGTTSVSTEPDDAMPEEEASVACLSTLSGFSTWSCGVDSSASEIFGLLIDRGKTALHLWNGSAWVRYSVVDGTMVPGSSDFMVTKSDILYISN